MDIFPATLLISLSFSTDTPVSPDLEPWIPSLPSDDLVGVTYVLEPLDVELYIEGRGFESESEIEESAVFCLLPSIVALLYTLPLPSPSLSLSVLSERLRIAVAVSVAAAVELEVGREVDDIDCLVRGPGSLGAARGTGRGGGRDRGRRAEEGGLRRGLDLGSVRETGVGDDEFTSSLSPPLSLSLSPCVLPAILSFTCCVID